MTGKEMTKEEITKAVELMKPIYDIEKTIQELMSGHYSLCGYAYNVSMELTKYKRAFEILKENLQFRFIGNCFQVCINNHWYFIKEYNLETEREQYELLEELMK